jgi:hypothetical protein
MAFSESDLQIWINSNIESLRERITNLDSVIDAVAPTELAPAPDPWLDTMRRFNYATNRVLDERFRDALSVVKSGGALRSLGMEFPLISSPLPGRDPAADILAVFDEMAAYALIEVKISANAARQCITELSAYTNGLGNKFIGLSTHDCIWIVISTEFRPTVTEAIVHQSVYAGRRILPLRAIVDYQDGSIRDVKFEVVDIRNSIDRLTTDSLLWSGAWCMSEIYRDREYTSRPALQHSVSLDYQGSNCSGFNFFRKRSRDFESYATSPFGLVVCTQIPFSSYLKRRQMRHFIDDGIVMDSPDYRQLFSSAPEDFVRVDLRSEWLLTEIERDDNGLPIHDGDDSYDYSLFELSIRTLNSGYSAFQKTIERVRGADRAHLEIGEPDFHGALLGDPIFNPTHYSESNMDEVHYFGIMHEAIIHFVGSMPLVADEVDSLSKYASPSMLLNIFRTANNRPVDLEPNSP